VVVADVAENEEGKQALLLVEGFMPAQSAHVARGNIDYGWVEVERGEDIKVSTWGRFSWEELRRW
jgi:hypothetical protein